MPEERELEQESWSRKQAIDTMHKPLLIWRESLNNVAHQLSWNSFGSRFRIVHLMDVLDSSFPISHCLPLPSGWASDMGFTPKGPMSCSLPFPFCCEVCSSAVGFKS